MKIIKFDMNRQILELNRPSEEGRGIVCLSCRALKTLIRENLHSLHPKEVMAVWS